MRWIKRTSFQGISRLGISFKSFHQAMQTNPRVLDGVHPLVVRDVTGDEDSLEITFEFEGKLRRFSRKKTEILKNTLNRMKLNLNNTKKKKKKPKQSECTEADGETDFMVELREPDDCEVVPWNVENDSAWQVGRLLHVKENSFTIFRHVAHVKALSLPTSIMAGFPVFPHIELESGDKNSSIFYWHAARVSACHGNSDRCPQQEDKEAEWKYVGEGFTFVPDVQLVEHCLKVVCIPGNERGKSPFQHEFISRNAISPGPGLCPFDQRQLYTQRVIASSSEFRVVCYNILADIYASGEFARKVLFPYCADYVIDYHYRRQLLLKEIRGYNADLVCLQECDVKCFDGYLTPALEHDGFEGVFKKKGGETSEGEAIFYRTSKFAFVHDASISMEEALKERYCEHIFTAMRKVQGLMDNFRRRKTIIQVVILKHIGSGKMLCVANTHLYYKPTGDHIRLLQTAVMLCHVKNVLLSVQNQHGFSDIGVIVCGDLNSQPDSAAIEFLLGQEVRQQHPVWAPENKEEQGFSLFLNHEFSFTSACGIPDFTNYVKGFQATLDYIMITPHLKVQGIVPFPTEDEIHVHNALPSVVSPSDHIALVCDLILE